MKWITCASSHIVIPAKAGIQQIPIRLNRLDSRFRGNDSGFARSASGAGARNPLQSDRIQPVRCSSPLGGRELSSGNRYSQVINLALPGVEKTGHFPLLLMKLCNFSGSTAFLLNDMDAGGFKGSISRLAPGQS